MIEVLETRNCMDVILVHFRLDCPTKAGPHEMHRWRLSVKVLLTSPSVQVSVGSRLPIAIQHILVRDPFSKSHSHFALVWPVQTLVSRTADSC